MPEGGNTIRLGSGNNSTSTSTTKQTKKHEERGLEAPLFNQFEWAAIPWGNQFDIIEAYKLYRQRKNIQDFAVTGNESPEELEYLAQQEFYNLAHTPQFQQFLTEAGAPPPRQEGVIPYVQEAMSGGKFGGTYLPGNRLQTTDNTGAVNERNLNALRQSIQSYIKGEDIPDSQNFIEQLSQSYNLPPEQAAKAALRDINKYKVHKVASSVGPALTGFVHNISRLQDARSRERELSQPQRRPDVQGRPQEFTQADNLLAEANRRGQRGLSPAARDYRAQQRLQNYNTAFSNLQQMGDAPAARAASQNLFREREMSSLTDIIESEKIKDQAQQQAFNIHLQKLQQQNRIGSFDQIDSARRIEEWRQGEMFRERALANSRQDQWNTRRDMAQQAYNQFSGLGYNSPLVPQLQRNLASNESFNRAQNSLGQTPNTQYAQQSNNMPTFGGRVGGGPQLPTPPLSVNPYSGSDQRIELPKNEQYRFMYNEYF